MLAAELLRGEPKVPQLRTATRELGCGVELTLKAALAREHWTLVFSRPDNARLSDYWAGSFHSASYEQCLQRLEQIMGARIPANHKKAFGSLRDRRNRLEHLGRVDNWFALRASLYSALSAWFFIARRFWDESELENSMGTSLSSLLEELAKSEHFVEARKREVGAGGVVCPRCGIDGGIVDDGFSCKFCLAKIPGSLAAHEFAAMADGYEGEVHSCECGEGALVAVSGDHEFLCFACGAELVHPESCFRCGRLHVNDSSLCEDCLANAMGS